MSGAFLHCFAGGCVKINLRLRQKPFDYYYIGGWHTTLLSSNGFCVSFDEHTNIELKNQMNLASRLFLQCGDKAASCGKFKMLKLALLQQPWNIQICYDISGHLNEFQIIFDVENELGIGGYTSDGTRVMGVLIRNIMAIGFTNNDGNNKFIALCTIECVDSSLSFHGHFSDADQRRGNGKHLQSGKIYGSSAFQCTSEYCLVV
eukprot:TRINITY_DN1126_c0_g1_i2.p1 TRINITY_DN1126_c0_g1~~TRINITY_DN1126_c0_g1_i2.p1  ORF type:complete len:204 (-),score=26.51 TRINITY_DN1126_c0_g1_i2:35-646(-)